LLFDGLVWRFGRVVRQWSPAPQRGRVDGVATTVVAGQRALRWLAVAGAVAVLAAMPAAIAALPVRAATVDPGRLLDLIRGSAAQPYQGFAVSTGTAALPSLPRLSDVTDLFNGDTQLRAWYAAPTRWRVDVIDTGAEQGVYQTPEAQYLWDYGAAQLTRITGAVPVRLPRGADLLPPALAQRLLAGAGEVRLSALPSRRVAGVAAAGDRVIPLDARTTVGSLDVWADPTTGLPLLVALTPRGAASPILTTRFLDLSPTAPSPDVLTPPPVRGGMGFTETDGADLARAFRLLQPVQLPERLADLPAAKGSVAVSGLGSYGTGFAQFVVVPLPRRIGFQAMDAATKAAGEPLIFASDDGARLADGSVLTDVLGDGVLVTTPLLNLVVVDAHAARRVYLVVGPVDAAVLREAARQLAAYVPAVP
jgi:hypothetical protein